MRDCGGRAAAKVYGRVKAGNTAASCASRRYRPSRRARRHSRAGGGRKRSAVRADIRAGVRQSTAARGYVCAAYFCTQLLHPSLWAQACGPAGMRGGGGRFRLCGGALRCGVRRFARGKRVKARKFVEKYRANRRACLTFHGNLCTIIKMEIFCPHEPCGRL